MTDERLVLDASAIIAYARNEPGAQAVAGSLRSAAGILVSAVNWAEAAGKLRQYGIAPTVVRHALAAVDAEMVPFVEADADAVALLTRQTATLGLSLGDRACIRLSIAEGARALTAERLWDRLAIPGLVVDQIR